jgi:tetratricopeptide (TPR) repeat protein
LSTMLEAELTITATRRQTQSPRLISSLRGDLDWIVIRCLDKDRTRRYDTANGLAMDIQRHLNNEPVLACPPSKVYRFQKLVRRNKLAVAAVGAVTVALFLGLGISTWSLLQERKARQRAVAAEKAQSRLRLEAEAARRQAEADKRAARTEAAKRQQVAEFLKKTFEGVGPWVALGRDTMLLHEILDKAVQRIGKDLTNQPEVEAELRTTIGEVYLDLGEHKKAEAMHTQALEMRRKLFGNEHVLVAASLHNLALVLYYQGRLAEAETMSRQALEIGKKTMSKDPRLGDLYGALADVLSREHKYDEAEQVFSDLTPAVGSQPQGAVLLSAHGDFRARTGCWKEAAADFSKVIDLKPEDHMAYLLLATLLVQAGQLDEYREHCHKCVEKWGKTTDATMARRTDKVCLILPSSGAPPETLTTLADTALVASGMDSASFLLIARCLKGWVEYRRGRFVSAVEWTQKAVVSGKSPWNNTWNNAEAYLVMAMAQQQLGQTFEARTALADAIELAHANLQKLEGGDPGDDWHEWIIVHTLMGEAKALINGEPNTASKPN